MGGGATKGSKPALETMTDQEDLKQSSGATPTITPVTVFESGSSEHSQTVKASIKHGSSHWNAVFDELRRRDNRDLAQEDDKDLASCKDKDDVFARVIIQEPEGHRPSRETSLAAQRILKCLEIRKRYVGDAVGAHIEAPTAKIVDKRKSMIELAEIIAQYDGDAYLSQQDGFNRITWCPFSGEPPGRDSKLSFFSNDGVFQAKEAGGHFIGTPVSAGDFCEDYVYVLTTMRDRECISYCGPRLKELELKFELHTHRNAAREFKQQQEKRGRDWYQVRKVDTHIHHSACFTQNQLLQYMRKKMRDEMDTVVMLDQGREMTLREVFSEVGVAEVGVNADRLCCMASMGVGGQHDTFGRFDKFNSKYNPFGDKRLRDIFLKTDNHLEGRFLAELTKEVMATYSKNKVNCAEWRISIYGKNPDEWAKLAGWFRKYQIQCPQVRWLIQVPRLYPIFKKIGAIANFADMLKHIFEPLFEASLDPAAHEDIFYMLQQVVGFDSVDDESQGTHTTLKEYPSPEDWDGEQNPPYTYWMYYMYANIRSLNALRRHRGLNTFVFRPHCGEAGNVSHLCSGFMLADSICHGVQLKHTPVMQYLFYLAQVGLAVSPLSNDILFVSLRDSPFGQFFKRGLNVSLSTDDPLIIHLTEDALNEEYVVAARHFKLSLCDLCEIARNSVLQSGFELLFKKWWVGDQSLALSAQFPLANASEETLQTAQGRSNVPTIRLQFREACLRDELEALAFAVKSS